MKTLFASGILWLLFSTQASARDDWQLLLFTIPGCTYCQSMRNHVIEPMIDAGLIRPNQFEEVLEKSDADWQYVRGVGYQQIRVLKKRYQTSLFPTLVVIDGQGNKLSDNMVGMTSVEHYRTKMETLIQQLNSLPKSD
jgi:thioredoxin-related protein